MKTKTTHAAIVASVLALVAACVTINVYFPEAAIKDMSEEIEEQVQRRAAETKSDAPPEEAPAEAPAEAPGGGASLFDLLTGTSVAHAGDVPEAEATSPAIRKIIESRAARMEEIRKYKSSGVIGESNEALLEVRALESLSDLRERAAVQKLVRAENADRETLFKEIAAAKNVELSQLPKIRTTYAETLRANAQAGDWIQMPDGTWKQK